MDVQVSPWLVLLTQAVATLLVAGAAWYLASNRYKSMRQGREEAMYESLRLANRTLPFLRRGLSDETAHGTAQLIYDYFQPGAVAIVAGGRLLAFVGAGTDHHQPGKEPARPAREALRTGRPIVWRAWAEGGCPLADCPLQSGVAAPLRTRERVLGVLQVLYGVNDPLTPGRVRVISALAQLMSVQIELAELDRKTQQLAKAELAALQAQISPHFVYNTLNTIAAFIRTKPDEARRLLVEFADFTRRSFSKRRGEFAPFAQELEYVHQYLGFEKARFGERLLVVYRVDPEVLNAVVPVLVLQPLVENAVRHGVAHKEGPVRVTVRAEDRGSECWITVQDDGVGIPPEVIQRLGRGSAAPGADGANGASTPSGGSTAGSGLGLANVHERLRSVYGPEYGLQIQGGPGEGTRVSFAVPKYSAKAQA